MIYYTGDIHGRIVDIAKIYHKIKPTKDDVIVILGDVAANFCLDNRDDFLKSSMNGFKCTIFCIQGNHEERPFNIPTYITKQWNGGTVWYEPRFPHLLFAKDGEIYNLEGKSHLVIGGAYSVDKWYRILRAGFTEENNDPRITGWFADEQPSTEIKRYVEQQIEKHKSVDVVLTHTCPARYTPTEAFLPNLDQSTVDRSTEEWLDEIEEKLNYKAWFCGHWHINKHVEKIHFLFHDVETFEDKPCKFT